MKNLYIVLILICNYSFGQIVPIDKQEHFAAGLIVSGLSVSSKEVNHPFWTSIGVATGIGLAKEAYDSRVGGKFDVPDICFTIMGGVVTGSISYAIKRKREKKKNKIGRAHV